MYLQVSAVSTISAPQRRIRRIAKYQPPPPDGADVDKSPALGHGGRPDHYAYPRRDGQAELAWKADALHGGRPAHYAYSGRDGQAELDRKAYPRRDGQAELAWKVDALHGGRPAHYAYHEGMARLSWPGRPALGHGGRPAHYAYPRKDGQAELAWKAGRR